MKRSRALVGLGFAVGLGGCTFEEGTGFSTLAAATVSAQLEVSPARALGEQRFLTDRYYELELDTAELVVGSLELQAQETQSSGGSRRFDPAKPPPGFTLCHAGHCHADDGRLVSYEDIQRDLDAGGAQQTASTIVSMAHEQPLNLWDGSAVELRDFAPSRELPRTSITAASLAVRMFEFSGTISAGPSEAGFGAASYPLRVVLPMELPLTRELALEITKNGPEQLQLTARVSLSSRIFDGIDFAAFERDGVVAIEQVGSEAGELLSENMLRTELEIELRQ